MIADVEIELAEIDVSSNNFGWNKAMMHLYRHEESIKLASSKRHVNVLFAGCVDKVPDSLIEVIMGEDKEGYEAIGTYFDTSNKAISNIIEKVKSTPDLIRTICKKHHPEYKYCIILKEQK